MFNPPDEMRDRPVGHPENGGTDHRPASLLEAEEGLGEARTRMREALARAPDDGHRRVDRDWLDAIPVQSDPGDLQAGRSLSTRRIRRVGRAQWGLLAALAILSGGAAALLFPILHDPVPAKPAAVTEAGPPTPPPTKIDRGPMAQAAPVRTPYRIRPPYEMIDAVTFGPEGGPRTRLAGLDGPSRDAVCLDRDKRPWACGLQARAALNLATRRADLACDPAGAADASGTITASCRSDAGDIAREVVLAGFARPTGSDRVLREAEQLARQEGRGLWNGGWTIRLAGR